MLCTWNRSGSFSSDTDSVHDDPFPAVSQQVKHRACVYTTRICFDIPVLLPIGADFSAVRYQHLPAAGGVIIYYFVRTVRIQSQALLGMDSDIVGKLTLLSDSLMKNGEMWLTLIAFIAVVLAVNLIRTRMFDYAWRIAIVAGGVIYIVIMLAGSMSLGISISVFSLIIYTVVAVLVGIILEFFVFGGDYTRTERLEYEDDDYYYYVKAVPKALGCYF